jgi:hypothetical protein
MVKGLGRRFEDGGLRVVQGWANSNLSVSQGGPCLNLE